MHNDNQIIINPILQKNIYNLEDMKNDYYRINKNLKFLPNSIFKSKIKFFID